MGGTGGTRGNLRIKISHLAPFPLANLSNLAGAKKGPISNLGGGLRACSSQNCYRGPQWRFTHLLRAASKAKKRSARGLQPNIPFPMSNPPIGKENHLFGGVLSWTCPKIAKKRWKENCSNMVDFGGWDCYQTLGSSTFSWPFRVIIIQLSAILGHFEELCTLSPTVGQVGGLTPWWSSLVFTWNSPGVFTVKFTDERHHSEEGLW